MDMMNIVQIGAQVFQSQLDKDRDGQLEITEIASALMGLFSGSNVQGQAQAANNPLGGLLSMVTGMQQSGNTDLVSLATSWLGSGSNAAISGTQVTQVLGADQIAAFAKQLGISPEQAVSGLQAALPQVVDKASPTGSLDLNSLLNSVGGVSGAINLASKIFGR
jgi:uncharacterized protein YidB (DUF937 family)